MSNLLQAIETLNNQGVIAYPTEGVYGVGCDPDSEDAILKLLDIKQRSADKGLILIACSFEQLLPYVDIKELSQEQLNRVFDTWPGPFTWIMPASSQLKSLVTGQFDTVAVRVTDHPQVQDLCLQFGKPITSTSANLSGNPACITFEEVQAQLGDKEVTILKEVTGGRANPSEIRDARSLQLVRKG